MFPALFIYFYQHIALKSLGKYNVSDNFQLQDYPWFDAEIIPKSLRIVSPSVQVLIWPPELYHLWQTLP